ELGILEEILNEADLLTDLTRGDDSFPAIDGYLHLLNKKREMIGQMLQVQVKSVRYKKGGIPVASCKMELFAHAYESSTPVVMLGVDSSKRTAYWAYLSPESVKGVLDAASGKKTTTILLPKKNIIKKDGPDYVSEWRRICLHHRNQSNDKIMASFIRKRKKDGTSQQISPFSLDTLIDLVFYRTNTGEYPFTDYAISLAGEVYRSDEDTKLRYMEVLERIYYHHAADVLKILFDLVMDKSKEVADKAKKILLEVSKYNIHILNTLGYGPHRILVDKMQDFRAREGKQVRSVAREILQNILSSSFEGTSNPNHITITFHHGPLEPTPYLQKIRQDAINLIFELFEKAEDSRERVDIISTLFHSFHAPDHPFGNDETQQRYFSMVNKEAAEVIKCYRKVVFPSKKTTADEYPLVYEIEHQTAWLAVWKRDIDGLQSFLTELRSIKTDYDFYRTIVGEAHDLNPGEEYEAGRISKEDKTNKYFELITTENIDESVERLAKVATFKGVVEDWKFNYLNNFLARIGRDKPEIADLMLSLIFKERNALYPLIGNFLFGFRLVSLPLWDKYVKQIEKDESVELTKSILVSFEFHPTANAKKRIRKKDLDLLAQIIRQEGKFSFLKGKVNRLFFYQCMRAALYVYKANPKQCRSLIIELFEKYPEEKSLFIDQISTALWSGAQWLNLDEWSKTELGKLTRALIEVPRFEHNEEQVLVHLGKRDFDSMIAVLDGRLKKGSEERTDFSVNPPRFSPYDAFPYRFSNQELSKLIQNHPKYKKVLLRWIKSATDEYAAESIDLSNLIRFIDGPILNITISELISTRKKENIKRVIALFPFTEAPDFGLCFQIIEATNDKDILN
ncbi:MAG: DUF4365 domain-containing protein, partial [Candidatus Taylorbacteria bacterium]|nr:DUF4365 domain-containing protein [Candidatus Taylorbacteria bacterium]